MTSITIPNGVTSIPDGSNSGGVFGNCSSLTNITLPEGITTIGAYAFGYCSSLTNITLPEGVTTIGRYVFRLCRRLESITIPQRVTTIGSNAFEGCRFDRVNISDLSAWCKIDFGDMGANPLHCMAKLYLNDEEITVLEIPSDVDNIKPYAFSGCSSLLILLMPDGVSTIGDGAFYWCWNLEQVSLYNVNTIGNRAFQNCEHLYSVGIPETVTTIGAYAFSGCDLSNGVYCYATTPPTVVCDSYYNRWGAFDSKYLRSIYVPRYSMEDYKAANGWKEYIDLLEADYF